MFKKTYFADFTEKDGPGVWRLFSINFWETPISMVRAIVEEKENEGRNLALTKIERVS